MAKSRYASPVDETPPAAPQDSGDTTSARADRERVANRAYELYMARGGTHGQDLEDWLAAEQELAREQSGRGRDSGNRRREE